MPQIAYPNHMSVRKVGPGGALKWHGQELHISETVIGEPIAFEQVDEFNYQIYFGPVKPAIYDNKKKKIIKPPISRRKRY